MTDHPYLRLLPLEHDGIFPKCIYQCPLLPCYFESSWSRDLSRDQILAIPAKYKRARENGLP